jgi:hypothetical protein
MAVLVAADDYPFAEPSTRRHCSDALLQGRLCSDALIGCYLVAEGNAPARLFAHFALNQHHIAQHWRAR